MRRLLVPALFSLAIVLLTTVAALADTIRLKDGSVLKGKVISYSQRKFTIVVYIGNSASQHVIPVEEVDSVEFDTNDAVAGTSAPRSVTAAPVGEVNNTLPVTTAPPPTESASTREQVAPPPTNDPPTTRPAAENEAGVIATLAEKNVSVAAAADWTSTDIRIQKGQRVVINATGEIDLGENVRSDPEGLNKDDTRKLIPNRPTGALIAVVGDDNDDFVYVGKSTEFIAKHNGILFLSVNESNLKDNSGAFIARVKVLSNK